MGSYSGSHSSLSCIGLRSGNAASFSEAPSTRRIVGAVVAGAPSSSWFSPAGFPRRRPIDRRQADGERDERASGAEREGHHHDEQPAEQRLAGGAPERWPVQERSEEGKRENHRGVQVSTFSLPHPATASTTMIATAARLNGSFPDYWRCGNGVLPAGAPAIRARRQIVAGELPKAPRS